MDHNSYSSHFSSEESVGNYVRDYTPEFTTEQIFESREDMLNWIRKIGRDLGIVVVISNSALLKGNKLPKCILGCERGGKYKSNIGEGETRKRNTGTRKCGCPFELRGIPIPPAGVQWRLGVVCGFHNHETAQFLDGHEYLCRLTPVEKEIVHHMGSVAAPREILSVLKKKDPSNTTGIRTIYNTLSRNKEDDRAGLNPTQFLLQQLTNTSYLHDYRTNSTTKQITDIIWVHPRSMELYVHFPTVLVIDATYKTNEYRMPLLEVVGITSTNLTYSLMFAYLDNEKENQLTWALNTLKKWMVVMGAPMPSVLVSDRDLALINAIEKCFPTARHILCVWHINENVMKKCSHKLGPLLKRFLRLWHSLIFSSQPEIYHQKWHNIRQEFGGYPSVLKYVEDTWLNPYKERFIAAWINTCMHLGSNTTQRVESAHSRLKKYLCNTMSPLDTSFTKIDKMVENQIGEIKSSFEQSINVQRHAHMHDNLYDELRGSISLHAMELIHSQLQSDASPHLVDYCDCTIRTTHGIPCAHEIARYRYASMSIPLQEIHVQWTRLSLITDDSSQIISKLYQMDPAMTGPTQSTNQMSESGSMRLSTTKRSAVSRPKYEKVEVSPVCTNQSAVTPIFDPFIQQLPDALRDYIIHTVDVEGDGNCGFRAIATLIGYGEDMWARVRMELIEELQNNITLYDGFYLERGYVNSVIYQLTWFETPAPPHHWMDSMTMGCVIASRYNIVLHTFETNGSHCFTHLPLRSPPVPIRERSHIAIARINQHFVQVFLRPHYPVPPIPTMWYDNVSSEAREWATSYRVRLGLWLEVMA